MPLGDKINVALREQNCQKIGSERVNEVPNVNHELNEGNEQHLSTASLRPPRHVPYHISWNVQAFKQYIF